MTPAGEPEASRTLWGKAWRELRKMAAVVNAGQEAGRFRVRPVISKGVLGKRCYLSLERLDGRGLYYSADILADTGMLPRSIPDDEAWEALLLSWGRSPGVSSPIAVPAAGSVEELCFKLSLVE